MKRFERSNGLDTALYKNYLFYVRKYSYLGIVIHVMAYIMIFCAETISKYVSIPSTSRAGNNKPRLPSSAIAKQPAAKRIQLQHYVTRNYDSFLSEHH